MIKRLIIDFYRYGVLEAVSALLDRRRASNGLGSLWVLRHCIMWGAYLVFSSHFALNVLSSLRRVRRINIWLSVLWDGGSVLFVKHQLGQKPVDEITLVVGPIRHTGTLVVHVWRKDKILGCFFIKRLDELVCLKDKCHELVVNHLIDWHRYFSDDGISVVGCRNVLDQVLRLKESLNVSMRFMVHDYFSVCPRFQLVDENLKYCNSEYSLAHCSRCLSADLNSSMSLKCEGDIREWRCEFGAFLSVCEEVRVFSEDTFLRMKEIYPRLKFALVPHRPTIVDFRIPKIQREKLVVGVVGNIIDVKGSKQVVGLAHYLDKIHEPARIVIIGNISGAGNIPSRIKVTGSYKREKLSDIIEETGVNIVFFSSVWPETFSYVTQELMLRKMPIACYALGAPGILVSAYEHGCVIPNITIEDTWAAIKTLAKRERIHL